MSTNKSFSADRIKQKKLFKIRILLFGCRKDLPKNAQSGDSLACTPKTSQLVDASSDIDRLPAGSSACGCQPSSEDLNTPKSSALNLSTQEVSTQTECDDKKSIKVTRPAALSQSCADRKDAGTQLSFSELSNTSSRAFIQFQYSNVSKKIQSPCNTVGEEDELKSEAASVCEGVSQKFVCLPRIVIDRSQSNISGSHLPRSPTGNQPTRSQPKRGQAVRNQPPRGQQPKGQQPRGQQPRGDNKSSRGQQRPVKQSAVAFEPSNKQNRQYDQLPPGQRPTEANNSEGPDAQAQLDQQTQCEETGNASMSCCRIPELLERVCQLESNLRQQERTLRGLQCSMKSSKPSKCTPSPPVCCKCKCIDQSTQKSNCSIQNSAKSCKSSTCPSNQPPKECGVPCKPTCPNQSPPKCGEEKPDCKALKKEFVDIFTRKDPTECTKKDCKKPITICSANKNCIDGRKMCLQCLEKSDVLMQQFTHMFVNPGNQGLSSNLIKPEKNRKPSLEQFEQFEQPEPETEICKINSENDISSSLPILTEQCLTERESKIENILDNCVDLVASTLNRDISNIGMVSSASCLTKSDAPKPFDSRQCLQKEVYESLMEQFIKYFTKPQSECRLNVLPAQKAEGEPYTFENLCAELVSLISKTKNLESSAISNEDKLTLGTISTSNTVMEKNEAGSQDNSISAQSDERNGKPCKVEYFSNDPPESPGDCQSCSDNGKLPVLESLVDEMSNLIGSRPFHNVVLTIMRRGCNVYHINIRERATGNVLGCLLANGAAVNEAISLGVFEDIPTFCELNRQRTHSPRDCPAAAMVPQREPGGETKMAMRNKAKAMEFVTRVLGLPVGEAERFFSLTSVLKTAKKSSDQSLGGTELSKVTESTGLIGRGAVTDNLIFLGTTGSQLDLSELGEESKHFLRLLSGQDTEDNDKL